MPTLALAGGTSTTLGRSITTAVLSNLYTQHSWKPIILSRSPEKPTWLQAVDYDGSRTDVRVVQYNNLESICEALHDVDTLISVTSAGEGHVELQKNLLEAAVRSGCRRFVPSCRGMGPKAYERGTFGYLEGDIWEQCLQRQHEIEVSRFCVGNFMNYLALGILPENVKQSSVGPSLEALQIGDGYARGGDDALEGVHFEEFCGTSIADVAVFISLRNAIATLPVKEDGSWPRISMTTMRDIGRFVAASLELPEWENNMNIAGDTISAGELLRLGEELTGKKFTVREHTKATLQTQLVSLSIDDLARLPFEFNLNYCEDEEGFGWLNPNMKLVSSRVKPVKIEEYLRKWWTIYK